MGRTIKGRVYESRIKGKITNKELSISWNIFTSFICLNLYTNDLTNRSTKLIVWNQLLQTECLAARWNLKNLYRNIFIKLKFY